MNFLEELIGTETSLRRRQSELGYNIIVCTCLMCLTIVALVFFSGFLNNDVTIAQIFLSDQFEKLIAVLSIPFFIGLTAGIILIKTSVKNIAKSYCDGIVSIENFFSEENKSQKKTDTPASK